MRYILGLDVGIASVGWSVLEINTVGEPFKIHNLGVRIFEKAEQPKTGAALALPRREARSARRRLRRRKHRMQRIKQLIIKHNILKQEQLEALYNGQQLQDIYIIRYEALERCLKEDELTRLLIHWGKRRGFKSNRKNHSSKEEGKLLQAVESNRQMLQEKGYRTVGEMLYKEPKFERHKRNTTDDYLCTVSREMMEEEIRYVFESQRAFGNRHATKDLEEAYLKIYLSQRSFDEGPGGNSPYRNPIQKMIGNCTFEPTKKRCPKACISFEYFVLLTHINNLRLKCMVTNQIRTVDDNERMKLIELANKKAASTYWDVRKTLDLDESITFKGVHIGHKDRKEVESKKLFVKMDAYHTLRKALDKIEKGKITQMSTSHLDAIGYALTVYKTDENIRHYLEKQGLDNEVIKAVEGISFSKFGHLSLEAIQRITPALEEGDSYDIACEKAGYIFNQIPLPERKKDFIDSVTNPVVRRGAAQSIKVVEAICRTYGKPAKIHIELARDMSHNFQERKEIEKKQNENKTQNEKLSKEMTENFGYKPNGQMLLKYKLWKEQDGRCLYSGTYIEPERLFSDPMYTDIDHIIPYSKSYDDSYTNKVLVISGENRQKGNQTPYEYLSKDPEALRLYEERVRVYIRNIVKQRKLLKQHIDEEDEKNFKERNLNDTRYMTKLLSQYFKQKIEFDETYEKKKKVVDINGFVTSYCRKRWGLTKVRENGDLHHALDAVVIACITDGMIQKVTKYHQQRELEEVKGPFPAPWEHFRDEVIARLEEDPNIMIQNCQFPTYSKDAYIRPVFVSRMPRRKHTGAGHKEIRRSGKLKNEGYTISRVPLTKLKLDKDNEIQGYYNKEANLELYEALRQRLIENQGKAEEAFKEPFYKPQKKNAKPIQVKKVKIIEKATLVVSIDNGKSVAANGDMARVDVFTNAKGQYFLVPVYVKDFLRDKLPNKAIVQRKSYDEWLEMDENYTFLYSLYSNDLLYIKSKKGIKLIKSDKTTKSVEEGCFYYKGTDIATGSINFITHDGQYSAKSVGVKTLIHFEKFEVDLLGNYYKVKSEPRIK